jgi:predicted ATP-grasp superfamily ATP-dependent carboligase
MARQTANSGVLLLSHCGFSFLEDLIAVLEARNVRSYVLSSLPLEQHRPERLAGLQQKVDRLFSTERHELEFDDIDRVLDALHVAGERVLACVSVWEGYRGLMAYANGLLGVPDLAPGKIDGLRNKLALRRRLYGAGLSAVRAQALTPAVLDRLREEGGRCFIKPVSGIASYGTFPLRQDTTWATIERIRAEAAQDLVYRSALSAGVDFLVEDYVSGREFSFELLAAAGSVHVVGLHEKCEVTETSGAVLEDSCTSPPYSIDSAATATGIAWVRALFAALELDWGCFHVEARYDGTTWELIEINPRVGGSLISHSVKALTGHGVLELWVDLLLTHGPGTGTASEAYRQRLAALSSTESGQQDGGLATFFRVYFARPGLVSAVALRDMTPAPTLAQVLLRPGDSIANSAREVFLGQLLWTMNREERDASLPQLLRSSDQAIEIAYASEEPAMERTPS